jgi:hypothetical protein
VQHNYEHLKAWAPREGERVLAEIRTAVASVDGA